MDTAYRKLPTDALEQLRVHLLASENLPCSSLLLPVPQKRVLFFQRQMGPTTTVPPLPVQFLGTLAVVLADSKPDGPFRDTQTLGDLVGWQLTHLGQPDGQTLLVACPCRELRAPQLAVLPEITKAVPLQVLA